MLANPSTVSVSPPTKPEPGANTSNPVMTVEPTPTDTVAVAPFQLPPFNSLTLYLVVTAYPTPLERFS